MTKGYQGSGEGVKSLYGLPTEEQLDALDWARKFMNDYERRKAKSNRSLHELGADNP